MNEVTGTVEAWKSRPTSARGGVLYEYEWHDRKRRVWVCTTRRAFNTALEQHWPRGATSVDIEYNSLDGAGGVPRVVSVAVDRTTAILWHRSRAMVSRRMPSLLIELLNKSSIPKLGFAIDEDLRRLATHTDWLQRGGWPRGTLDVQTWWRVFGPSDEFRQSIGLADAVERYTGQHVAKHMQLGRWDAPWLNLDQIVYAAGDVFSTLDMLATIRRVHHRE